jgi:hypothetical protein
MSDETLELRSGWTGPHPGRWDTETVYRLERSDGLAEVSRHVYEDPGAPVVAVNIPYATYGRKHRRGAARSSETPQVAFTDALTTAEALLAQMLPAALAADPQEAADADA